MIRNNESVMQVVDTLGAAGEGNDGLPCEHVVQQLHRMTGALGPGHNANISEREITGEILQRVG